MAVTDMFVDSLKALPDQFLDVLEVTQKMILSNVASVAESTKAFTPVMPALPLTARLPDPVALAEGALDFFEKVWASQRDFSIKLLETYIPADTVDSPVEVQPPASSKASTAAKASKSA